MMLDRLRHIYFIGVGGIGMSALARLFALRGIRVSGYDRTATPLTAALQEEGIHIHFDDDVGKVPADADLVVYTPAIPGDHHGMARVRELGLPLLKRSEVLGMLSEGMFTAAIAGTHGKTSISSMLTHLLDVAGIPLTGLVGGIMRNYDSNLLVRGDGANLVVEADEYDRSFHRLHPDIALISAIDADHLDIYGNHEQVVRDYRSFAERISEGGSLLLHHSLEWSGPENCTVLRYGKGTPFRAESAEAGEGCVSLRFSLDGKLTPAFDFHIPGRHNIDNALGAAAMAVLMGASPEAVAEGLSTYAGVVRRFDIRFRSPNLIYIDDYAHHPRELDATIEAVREFFPGRRITGVFQPHLFSRTRDFAEGFAASLDRLDTAYLMDIYPAREAPVPGVDAAMIGALMKRPAEVLTPSEVISMAERLDEGVLLTLGAGDIDRLVAPLTGLYHARTERRNP